MGFQRADHIPNGMLRDRMACRSDQGVKSPPRERDGVRAPWVWPPSLGRACRIAAAALEATPPRPSPGSLRRLLSGSGGGRHREPSTLGSDGRADSRARRDCHATVGHVSAVDGTAAPLMPGKPGSTAKPPRPRTALTSSSCVKETCRGAVHHEALDRTTNRRHRASQGHAGAQNMWMAPDEDILSVSPGRWEASKTCPRHVK